MPPLLDITLPLPPSINASYRSTSRGGFYKTRVVKDYQSLVALKIKEQSIEFSIPPKTRLFLFMRVFMEPKTIARRDLDNCLKGLIDAVFSASIDKANDSQIYLISAYKETPRPERGETEGVHLTLDIMLDTK